MVIEKQKIIHFKRCIRDLESDIFMVGNRITIDLIQHEINDYQKQIKECERIVKNYDSKRNDK